MYEFLNKIKAVIKILISVIISIFIIVPIALILMLIIAQEIISLLVGVIIIIFAIIVGSALGAKWAKRNVLNIMSAKKIAIWSASMFFIISMFFSIASNLLLFFMTRERGNFLLQFAQIIVPTFIIYVVSRHILSKGLDKI